MIQQVKVTNHLNESITLELRFPEKSGFLFRGSGIEGLGPGKSTINLTEISSFDGGVYNSGRLSARNIVMSLGFLPSPTIEDTRQKSYKYFPIKRPVVLEITTDNRITLISGYVESNEPDIFSKEEGTTISIVCPNPYLYSANKNITLFSGLNSTFEFPFSNESLEYNLLSMGDIVTSTEQSIFYEGDSPVGIVIYIHALGSITNLRIHNQSTNQLLTIDDDRFTRAVGIEGEEGIIEGDDLILSTIKGQKYFLLQRRGHFYNVLNSLMFSNGWFVLEKGDNHFSYLVDYGIQNIQFRIENLVAYQGV